MAKRYYKEFNQAIASIVFTEEKPADFNLIDDYGERVRLHTKRYKRTQEDGVLYFHEFQAKMYISIIDGVNSPEDVVMMQTHLKLISSELKEGSWMTAQATLPSIQLSGLFDQEMKDQIQSDINNYVTENY